MTTRTQADFYDDPSIYDILHTPGTAAEVTGLEQIAARFVPSPPRRRPTWLEPACGTGRYLRVAANRNIRVIGFDLSQPMIDYAITRMPPGADHNLFAADLTDFSSGIRPASVDLAFNLINTIRHLASDADMLAHFEEIARVLRPGGVYAVGLSTTVRGVEQPSEDVWSGKRGRCEVRQIVQYLPPEPPKHRPETVISHMTVLRPRNTEYIDSTYHLRTYEPGEWSRLLARSPLREIATTDEMAGDVPPPRIGYALRILTHK